NAYLASCRRGERAWPPELARLQAHPADWRPEDCYVVLLGFGITLDLDLPELSEARAVADSGAAWATNRRRYEDRWLYDSIPDSAAARLWPWPASALAPPAPRGARLPAAVGAAGGGRGTSPTAPTARATSSSSAPSARRAASRSSPTTRTWGSPRPARSTSSRSRCRASSTPWAPAPPGCR